MVTDRMSTDIAPDPYVRRIRKDEMEAIMPACVAMFTEEVGVSPLAGDGGLLYQARVAELVGSGRSFARLDADGKVVFKAEIGAATTQACQIQGVWVAPEYRGGAWQPRAWQRSCAMPSQTWPRWSASTSTTSTRRREGRTRGWASRR